MLRLIADSISDCIKIGIYKGNEKLFSVEKQGMALENFFDLLSEACSKANVEIGEIQELIFCEGTGSVLGIRCASVSFFSIANLSGAKVFTYNIFDIARYLCFKKNVEKAQIICDSKKGFYNLLELDSSKNTNPLELSYEDFEKIKGENIFYLKQRAKQVVKEEFTELSYTIDDIFDAINSNEKTFLVEAIEVKDALLLSKREFVKWNLQADI
ncbi:MAG: hypothetical protein R3Y46_05340 [Opitutales bacterium]